MRELLAGRFRRLGPAYAIAIVAWLILSRWPGHALVYALQKGAGAPWLRRAVLGLPEYTDTTGSFSHWDDKAAAVAIALAFHLLLVVWLGARRDSRRLADDGSSRAVAVFSFFFLIYTAASGAIQDYVLYLVCWQEVARGNDPWYFTTGVFGTYPLNAYGPLFNVFAFPALLNPLLPKLCFAIAYLGFVGRLFSTPGPSKTRSRGELAAWFLLVANPYFWVEIAHFGHFDVIVGILCVAAVTARARDRDLSSGTYLALGALLKYVPLLLVPFVALVPPRHRWRIAFAAAGITAAGLAISVLIWGPSTFRPIVFAAQRPSHHLSIFRFLNGRYSPLSGLVLHENPANWAPAFLILALGIALAWSERQRLATLPAGALAMVITALLYQAGFTQYHMVGLLLLTWWLATDPPPSWKRSLLVAALVPYLAWLGTFDVLCTTLPIDDYGMQEWTGLLTFFLGVVLIAAISISAPRAPAGHAGVPDPDADPPPR
ncbi:glycosyltransferase 87 family protein [Aquisphaera insulae]|uniref:glycosyltransferase 87 family protein n=1 Tax=Aquisphaera insulae TaxID=2712864 RepID=UPI0013EC3F56|nr:glycosyltransferase 87 family protein [Aquisphaera insulae]